MINRNFYWPALRDRIAWAVFIIVGAAVIGIILGQDVVNWTAPL